MKIKIKTTLITLEIEDDVKEGNNGFLRHSLPDLIPAIKEAVTEAIRLHEEVKK